MQMSIACIQKISTEIFRTVKQQLHPTNVLYLLGLMLRFVVVYESRGF